MTIVTYVHRPKRAPRRKAQAAAIELPRSIVVARRTKRLQPRQATPGAGKNHPEAEANMMAFFRRMMPNH